jgi:hypothetical protein
MSSDRGTTVHRGMTPSVDQQAPWAEPTTPAARKLPGAPRERKPALAALAVLLIVGGALAVSYLMLTSSKKVAAIEIVQTVGEGQPLALSDMQQVQVTPSSGLNYVPWSEAGQVARTFAATNIPAGTLLTNNMAVTVNDLTAGRAVLGLALKDGQLPAGLAQGDRVNIYEVSDASQACPGAPGSLLSGDAIVLKVSAPSATSSSAVADVEVALTPATAGAVACSASNGIIGVAVTPGNVLAPGTGGSGTSAGTGAG